MASVVETGAPTVSRTDAIPEASVAVTVTVADRGDPITQGVTARMAPGVTTSPDSAGGVVSGGVVVGVGRVGRVDVVVANPGSAPVSGSGSAPGSAPGSGS